MAIIVVRVLVMLAANLRAEMLVQRPCGVPNAVLFDRARERVEVIHELLRETSRRGPI